jgi:hypothetical protein
MKFKLSFTIAKLVLIVFLPITLLILPADFFDEGTAVCLSRVFFDVECYACGLTRACQHLIHLDFFKAFEYNMACFIVLPLLGVVWIQWFIKEWKILQRLRPAPTPIDPIL